MRVYNYHPITKVFVSSEPADTNPLEEGKFLLPANATFIPLPNETLSEGFYYIWNDKEEHWECKEKPKIPEDIAWNQLRQERNIRLFQTDWMFIVRDYQMTIEKEYALKKYRQELRDLPSITKDPYNPIWPSQPI